MALNYKIGDALGTGETVKEIVGQGGKAGVFFINGGGIRYEFNADECLHFDRAITKLETLRYTVETSIAPKHRYELQRHIANSCFLALHCAEVECVERCFRDVEERVYHRAKASQSLHYLAGSLGFPAILAVGALGVLAGTSEFSALSEPILMGVFYGAMGASISVLQRLTKLEIHPMDPLRYATVQGIARTGLGSLFGLLFVLAYKAGLVLPTFEQNLDVIGVFSALAGLSERFIPELIERIESTAGASK